MVCGLRGFALGYVDGRWMDIEVLVCQAVAGARPLKCGSATRGARKLRNCLMTARRRVVNVSCPCCLAKPTLSTITPRLLSTHWHVNATIAWGFNCCVFFGRDSNMPADIRSFFGGGPPKASQGSQKEEPAPKKTAPKKKGRTSRVVEDSDDDEEESK